MLKVALLMLLLIAPALADDEAPGTHINPVPSLTFSNTVWEFYMESGAIKSMPIKVQALPEGKAIVCFKYPTDRWPVCFYRNEKTGDIVLRKSMSNAEST